MNKKFFSSRRGLLFITLLIGVTALLTMGVISAVTPPGCNHVNGRLYNAPPGTDLPGRMVGGISGDYYFEGATIEDREQVTLTFGTSHVDGRNGTLTMSENSVLDFAETQGYNGASLVVITGGTGEWEGASGHIILSGYFHVDDFIGQWDYQGDLCIP